MKNLLWSGVGMLLLLSGCGWNGTPTRKNDFVPLTSISIVALSPAVAVGTSTRVTATGNYSGLFSRDITDQVVWASDSNAEIITAAGSRRARGLAPGTTAILTANVGGISATCPLMVSAATVTAVTIAPSEPSIAKGLVSQLTATGALSNSTEQDLTFDVNWTSAATDVASVDDTVVAKGYVKSLAVGTSTITATFPLNGVRGATLLTVTKELLQSITVTPSDPSLLTLSAGSFHATGNYSDGSRDITPEVVWSSSNPAYATISSGGAVSTLTQGTTTISAHHVDGVTGTANLKVTGGNLAAITLSASNVTQLAGNIALPNGAIGRLTAIGAFSNGAIRDITGSGLVVWGVADTAAATVITPGGNLAWLNATAVTANQTAVTAKYDTITVTTNLTVTAPTLQSISITPTGLDLIAGTTSRFTVTASYSNGMTPNQDVTALSTWTSSDISKATVGNDSNESGRVNKGRVSGVSATIIPVTITAEYGGKTITVPVTVTALTLQSLSIFPATASAISGNQVKFAATAGYTGGISKNVTEDVTWTIDKPYVTILADSLNQPGQVVAVDHGTAILKGSFSGKVQTATITVP